MTVIVKTITRLTLGFILLYGIYITLNGHVSPGGGFAGGVIIALAFMHIMLAFGKEEALKRLRVSRLRILAGAGALIFLILAVRPCGFIDYSVALPLCEMAVVGFGIFAIFTALVLISKTGKYKED